MISKSNNFFEFGLNQVFIELFSGQFLLFHAENWVQIFLTIYGKKGDAYYKDVVARTEYVLTDFLISKVFAILCHQGEDDVNNTNYQALLDTFIEVLQVDLEVENIPLIVATILYFWFEQLPKRISIQQTQNIHQIENQIKVMLNQQVQS